MYSSALFRALPFTYVLLLSSIRVSRAINDLHEWPLRSSSVPSHQEQLASDWNRFGQLLPKLILSNLSPSFLLDQLRLAANQSNAVSSTCRAQLDSLHRNARNGNATALQSMTRFVCNLPPLIVTFSLCTCSVAVLDSWGRFPPSGFFRGSWSSLGSFDLCLQPRFKSQYCTIRAKPTLVERPRFHNILEPIPQLKRLLANRDKEAR
jgi:hypothetical protein